MALVPVVIEKESNGERSWDLYSRLLKDRIIMVQGPIEPAMANIVKAELLFLESEDPEAEITMYIDSPGGQVSTGMGIVDTMDYIKPDVRTVCCGLAASMGSVLLMCGTKGKRMALPHSERAFEQSKRIKSMMEALYVLRTGQSAKKIAAALDRDYYMTPEEALAFGLIDEIIKRRA